MQVSSPFASTRSFFKSKSFRNRKPKPPQPQQDLSASQHTTRKASVDTTNTTISWQGSVRQILSPSKRYARKNPNPSEAESASRKSNDTIKEPVMVVGPFIDLPAQTPISPSLLGVDEYRALGITTPKCGSRAGSPRRRFIEDDDDMLMNDISTYTTRERRPDLQVRIPHSTPPPTSPRLLDARNGGPTPSSALSTPSSLPTGRVLKSATTATPHSMVSPLTGLEMPRSHRPFSTDSFEDITQQASPAPQIHDNRRLYPAERSRRSSITSNFVAETPRPGDTPVVGHAIQMRTVATNLYHRSLVPASAEHKKGKNVVVDARPTMHRKASTVSVASQININKPLPPEPTGGTMHYGASSSPLKHIAFSTTQTPARSQNHSRSNSILKKPERLPQHVSDSPSPETRKSGSSEMGRRGSQSSIGRSGTLRSKFTPKDAESTDDATRQQQRKTANNSAQPTPTATRSRSSPNQSQISLADTNYLHTIVENSPRSSRGMSALDEPMQFSRGPMKMEPSRRPPQPPSNQQLRVHTIEVDKVGRKRSLLSRAQSNNSVTNIKQVSESSQRRPSTNEFLDKESGREHIKGERKVTERPSNEHFNCNLSKADRILGLSGASALVRPSFESRPNYQDLSRSARSPVLDDSDDEAFYDIRGKQDAHFEEIQDRLRLLSPKDDPTVTFDALRQAHSQRDYVEEVKSEPKRKPQEVKSMEPKPKEVKPTIEEKLHLTGTLADNPIVPTFIAELEADKIPSPVELPSSDINSPTLTVVVEEMVVNNLPELGMPTPEAILSNPIASESIKQVERRGRPAGANPLSSASGKTKSMHSSRSLRARSLASIAASDIPDYYNSSTPTNHSKRPSTAGSESEDIITADAAEQVLLHILLSLDNLEDLFAAALVSKGFYRTFKRHELYLLKHAIWKMSPAAWELREMSVPFTELEQGTTDYTPALYFRYYVQDLLTMVELKAMILESCKSFLRPETISGLTGETERSPMIDEAFWRVWTFCRIFGCGNRREEDIVGQMDWLRGGIIANQSSDTRTLTLSDELARNSVLFNPPWGFARGNGKSGLTAEELYDMIEIWTCLGVLVRGYHGKRQEARDYGVYDKCNVPIGDVVTENAFLEEWTHYLLTLAPSTVLDVTSAATPTRTQFAQARSQGYTKWNPPRRGMSRSTFLKEAASRVYEEKMSERSARANPKLPSVHPSISADAAIAAKARIARHAAEIRKQKEDPSYRDVPVSDDRPLSNYSDVLDRLEAISAATDAPPMPKLPGLKARLSRAKSKGSVVIHESLPVRPTSPSSTVQSSAASIQNSFSTADNLSTPDVTSLNSSKAGRSMIKNAFQKKSADSSVNHSPSKTGPGRFASLRAVKLLEKSKSKKEKSKTGASSNEELSALPSFDEKFAIIPEDPADMAISKLVGLGYEPEDVKKALAHSDKGAGVDYEVALAKLKKDLERKKRLERLQTMG